MDFPPFVAANSDLKAHYDVEMEKIHRNHKEKFLLHTLQCKDKIE